MSVTYWTTMAVEDPDRARAFYAAIGFAVRPMPGGAGSVACPDANSMICLFPVPAFRGMIPGEPCDARRAQEVIQSVSVPTRADVDALIAKAASAGGRALGPARDEPFGYAGGFADPDGHLWSVLSLSQPGG